MCTLYLLIIRARAHDQSKEKEAQPKEDDSELESIGQTKTRHCVYVHSLQSKTRERQRDRETHRQILRGVPWGEPSRDHAKHIYIRVLE